MTLSCSQVKRKNKKISKKNYSSILSVIHSFTQQMFILCLCYVFCASVQVALFLSWSFYSFFPGWSLNCSLYYSKHLKDFVRVATSPFTSLISLHYVLHKRNCSKHPGSIFLSKQRPQFLAGCVTSRLKYFLAFLVASVTIWLSIGQEDIYEKVIR